MRTNTAKEHVREERQENGWKNLKIYCLHWNCISGRVEVETQGNGNI
jgi:phosphopantetheine adenylyltransferase